MYFYLGSPHGLFFYRVEQIPFYHLESQCIYEAHLSVIQMLIKFSTFWPSEGQSIVIHKRQHNDREIPSQNHFRKQSGEVALRLYRCQPIIVGSNWRPWGKWPNSLPRIYPRHEIVPQYQKTTGVHLSNVITQITYSCRFRNWTFSVPTLFLANLELNAFWISCLEFTQRKHFIWP